MRINNPQAMVGFKRNNGQGQNTEFNDYNLATVGQVKAAIDDLRNTVNRTLWGNENFGLPEGNHGYAWLNGQGVVDTSLLPKLAITETHTVSQSVLENIARTNGTTFANDETAAGVITKFRGIMNSWLTSQVQDNVEGKTFQEGDIIIVTAPDGEKPNPVYSGSYIITDIPRSATNQTDNFMFSKLAYSDGNVVNVNDKTADNTGNLTLNLYDILKTNYLVNYASQVDGVTNALRDARDLESSVYRLVTINEGEDGYRFGFIDNSDQNKGVIAYTKLSEFTDEQAYRTFRDEQLSAAIRGLSERHDYEHNALIEKHNQEMEALEAKHDAETSFISSTIGKRTDLEDAALSATIFAQTKKLRTDVDTNLDRFERMGVQTDLMLALVQANAQNLHQGLNRRAVRLYIQDFTWEASNGTVLTDYYNAYHASATNVSGIVRWSYTYSPVAGGTTYNDAGLKSDELAVANVNAKLYHQGILNSAWSEERVLAVYDEDFNQVTPDIKIGHNSSTGLTDTTITVDIDNIPEGSSNIVMPSLAGKTWHLLIAKTIDGITFNENAQSSGNTKLYSGLETVDGDRA